MTIVSYRQTDHESMKLVNIESAKDLSRLFLAGKVKFIRDADGRQFTLDDLSVIVFDDNRFVAAMASAATGDTSAMIKLINEKSILVCAIDLFGEHYAEHLLGVKR